MLRLGKTFRRRRRSTLRLYPLQCNGTRQPPGSRRRRTTSRLEPQVYAKGNFASDSPMPVTPDSEGDDASRRILFSASSSSQSFPEDLTQVFLSSHKMQQNRFSSDDMEESCMLATVASSVQDDAASELRILSSDMSNDSSRHCIMVLQPPLRRRFASARICWGRITRLWRVMLFRSKSNKPFARYNAANQKHQNGRNSPRQVGRSYLRHLCIRDVSSIKQLIDF